MKYPIILFPVIFMAFTFLGSDNHYHPYASRGKVIQTDLYFGLSKQHGGSVSDAEWSNFADTVISKVFVNGMTVQQVEGQWLDSKTGIRISEHTRLVVAVNEMTKDLSARIDTIRAKYCRYYDQASVLRIDQRVKMKY